MNARILIPTALVFLGLAAAPSSVYGQQPSTTHEHDHQAGTAPPAPETPPAANPGAPSTESPDMMAMMSRMHAADARLDGLVKAMAAATGDAKIDAMAALLTALVEERCGADDAMAEHMKSMMEHGMMMGGKASGPDHPMPQK